MNQQYLATLGDVTGFVRSLKPNIDPGTVRSFVNQRIRTVLNGKMVWSGLIRRGVIAIPDAVSGGSVALATGSPFVNGTSTAWPANDVVNTVISAAVEETGLQWVQPSSMDGIDVDTALVVDSGSRREVVSVIAVSGSRFFADFGKAHNANTQIMASSLAGRQIKYGAQYPVFSIRAVYSATQLEMDMPWGGVAIPNASYQIILAYTTLHPNAKHVLHVTDPVQPLTLSRNVSLSRLAVEDPQRETSGEPAALVDFGPNGNGNNQYEIYPHQTSARQLVYAVVIQWPELLRDDDRLPPFINPNLWQYGAAAQALRTKVLGVGVQANIDPYYDPVTANTYEQYFERDRAAAELADESKVQVALTSELERTGMRGGANWAMSHDITVSEMYGGY